jgi:hypothetical protein
MFSRATTRKKDGKEHRYWSVVENRRVAGGRVVQRHVLYLGEINSSQELAWRKSIEVLEDGEPAPRTYSLFPEDRCEGLLPDESIVRLKLKAMRLHRPRQWGACWLALTLWQTLDLDVFWAERLPPSRKGTRWDLVLFVLGAYRLIAPGSEWRLHREWYGRTALSDLLSADEALADPHVLYGCHDRLLAHKEALFTHLTGRWRDLFNVSFEVLLYDLTSTYFESNPPLWPASTIFSAVLPHLGLLPGLPHVNVTGSESSREARSAAEGWKKLFLRRAGVNPEDERSSHAHAPVFESALQCP